MHLFIFYCFIVMHFSLLGRVTIIKRCKKTATFICKIFFFFLPKTISYDESSARKNKNANLSGHVIPALKSDPSKHCCRIIRKASY